VLSRRSTRRLAPDLPIKRGNAGGLAAGRSFGSLTMTQARRIQRFERLSLSTFGICIAWTAAPAQSVVLRIRVADSAGVAVSGAQLSLMRGLNSVVATAAADSRGERALTLKLDSGAYELVARRIGYSRASRLFTVRGGDTLSLSIQMSRLPETLAAVHVTAEEDLKHKRLFIDADAIAASPRPIFDGTDILKKLRPDMVAGLGLCPVVQEIWVNGRRIHRFEVPADPMAVARATGTILRKGRGRSSNSVPDHVITVLASIHPEHIDEMRYVGCMDTSVPGIGAQDALFIVLKPGVAFEVGRGSYVAPGRAGVPEVATPPTSRTVVADIAAGCWACSTLIQLCQSIAATWLTFPAV
jgi:hypothetical protein